MSFENSAGLNVRNHYGARTLEEAQKFGFRKSINAAGNVEVEWVFNYDDLPDPANLSMEAAIPKGAVLVGAKFQTMTAFTGGTSFDIGLQQNDGTEIDNDGLWDALLLAETNAENEWSDAATHTGTNSGVLLLAGASAAGLAANGYLTVAATGTYTAGKGRVIIEYTEARYDPTGNYVAGGVKGAG